MGVPLILTTEKHGVGICEFHAVSTEPFLTRHLCMTMLLSTCAAVSFISILDLPHDYSPWLWLCGMLLLVVQRAGLTCAESLLVVHDLGIQVTLHPGGNPGANLKSISHKCHLFEVAFVWELTKETIVLPLG